MVNTFCKLRQQAGVREATARHFLFTLRERKERRFAPRCRRRLQPSVYCLSRYTDHGESNFSLEIVYCKVFPSFSNTSYRKVRTNNGHGTKLACTCEWASDSLRKHKTGGTTRGGTAETTSRDQNTRLLSCFTKRTVPSTRRIRGGSM